jgi:3-oxoacyl-[acyl-carrier-protein] synthase III
MAFLRAFGVYLPSRTLTNREIAERLGCEEAWIRSASGISTRRIAEPAETVADLATRAAEDCLARAGVDRSRIGMVLVSSGSSERRFPGPASSVAARLGLVGVPAIDLPIASAGAVFGLALAHQLAPVYGEILLVAAEKMSDHVWRDPVDRNTAILFGDGAGACSVSAREGLAETKAAVLHSDGNFAEDLRLDFGRPLHMNGRSVIMQVSRKLPRVIEEVLEAGGVAASQVDVFLLHQANQNLIVRVAQAVNAPSEKFFSNIEHYGNTSSASMLIAAAEWSRQTGFHPGRPVVFAGFGAGLHWGAVLAVGS